MLLAFFMIASLVDWVPARWFSADPKSLDVLAETPVNCLLVESGQWSEPFAAEAAKRGIAVLGVIRPGADPIEAARKAIALQLSGVVLEGSFDPAVSSRVRNMLSDSRIAFVELSTRAKLRFDSSDPILGTYQGVWPGVQVQAGGETKAAPSGAPWIDTNTGFLRFARASTDATIWIANGPPAGSTFPLERYLQAIGDAAMTGARWVVSLDPDFNQRLLAADPAALNDWKQIARHLRYFENHKNWRMLRARGSLALVEDANSGALLSGGILDMIAVKHTPVRPVPNPVLSAARLAGSKLAVNVDPSSLDDRQKDILKAYTRAGGTLLTGPPGWKFPVVKDDAITLEKQDLDKLDEIWKELNSLTGRRNLGARLFNVSSMLSNLQETPDGKQVVLQLVNYSDFPVENIAIHILGTYHHAKLYRPDGAPLDLALYEVEEGTGVDIEKMGAMATLVLD